jgi:hypothetical protein
VARWRQLRPGRAVKAGKSTVRDNLIRSWCDGYAFLGRYPVTLAAGHLVVIDAEMPAGTARRWLNDQMITHAERFHYMARISRSYGQGQGSSG